MKKLSHPWRLTIESAKDIWRWKKPLLVIIAVVAVPVTLVSVVTQDADPAISTYSAFATLIMNVALIWSIHRLAAGEKAGLKKAYYQGTAPVVRFILLSGLYFLMLLPLLAGALIYLNGTTGITPVGVVENLLLGAVWLVLAAPSLFWLNRSLLGIFALDRGDGPIEAVRASRALVSGQGWLVFGRLLWLLFMLLVLVTLPAFVVLSTLNGSLQSGVLSGLQFVATLVVLPLMYTYMHRLYRELGGSAA